MRSRSRPLLPRRLVLVWALSAAVLAAGIVAEQATQGPLDDPRQARQRPGLLNHVGKTGAFLEQAFGWTRTPYGPHYVDVQGGGISLGFSVRCG